jgi:prepilin-type N-terminal cleavage/methylation domain-containing protein
MSETQTLYRRPLRPRCARRAGFTLLELLIILAVIGIMSVIVIPAFVEMMWRNKVESAARQTTVQMRSARFRAIQTGQEHGIFADFANEQVVLFQGTDAATGTLINAFPLPGGIHFQGPGDGIPNGPNAVVFTPVDNEDATGGWVVFAADGSADDEGAIRVSMPQRELYFETRVGPQATGRTAILRWNGTLFVE